MRTEKEMFDLIIKTAADDTRIHGALLSGSRANFTVKKDIYQDFDVTYFVNDVAPFYNNMEWVHEKFGEVLTYQLPELFTLITPIGDGNRLDLTITDKTYTDNGEPTIVLLDKNGSLPKKDRTTDECWHVQPPSATHYADCCNEFWWCLNNVAKGIARDELPYAMQNYNVYVREMLHKMLAWYIGVTTEFTVSAGKMGKNFKKFLPDELYSAYLKTYSDSNYTDLWASIDEMCDLFKLSAYFVAKNYGFTYNQKEEEGMRLYLSKVKASEYNV